MEGHRFSVLAYAGRRKEGIPSRLGQTADSGHPLPNEGDEAFSRLTEEIRGELTSPRGRTEEERQEHTETLNGAVLGYETDRRKVFAIIQDILAKKRVQETAPRSGRYGSLAEAVFSEIVGWSVLELVLKDKEGLEEIQVVGRSVFEVRGGVSRPSPYRLDSVKELERLQQNLVLFNGDTLNLRKRWAEVSLRDGSRVTMTGFGYTSLPTLTIRFYIVQSFSLTSLYSDDLETMTARMADLLRCLIRSGFNLVVIGPTNSGKTSLIKALIAEMPDHERLITIESRYELAIKRDFPEKNVIEYEIDEEDQRHDGRQAFKLALRQSPKRICHAEIRDVDANIYVRACTRGHEGSITTVHVNGLEDAPDAITDMCMMDGRGMDPKRLVRRITEYVTQIGLEMAIVNGKRKLVRIGEYEYKDGDVCVRDIVRYNFVSNDWSYPADFSSHALTRIQRYDADGFQKFAEEGGEYSGAAASL